MSSASLRDELAAVLGPGNDDTIAYEQADTVLAILDGHRTVTLDREIIGATIYALRSAAYILEIARLPEINGALRALADHLEQETR